MGGPRKQHKKYTKPRTPFNRARIEEEKALMKKFGLKNKRELWRARSYIDRIRTQAKKLILQPEQQQVFLIRLIKLGLIKQNATIDDVLALDKQQLLERRLQTIVFKKKLARTPKEARQLIVHKKVKISNKTVDVPGYIVKIKNEPSISVIKKKINKK